MPSADRKASALLICGWHFICPLFVALIPEFCLSQTRYISFSESNFLVLSCNASVKNPPGQFQIIPDNGFIDQYSVMTDGKLVKLLLIIPYLFQALMVYTDQSLIIVRMSIIL